MKWWDLEIDGRTLSMAHLHPFDEVYQVDGQALTVKFDFGFHCFTDDKGNGKLLKYGNEKRYFCADRYHCSTQITEYIQKRFFAGLVVPYYVENNQRYFCMDLHDYAIFFSIRKPNGTTNLLKVRIISAYEVDQWGRGMLPKGRPHNVRYVLEMRNSGKSV